MFIYMLMFVYINFTGNKLEFHLFSECDASADVWLGVDWAGEQLLWASDGALVSDGYTNWKGAAVELSNCVKKESADRGSQWSLSSCFATLNVVCETPDPKDYAFDCKIAIAYTFFLY